ncbi:cell division protein FtsQ/DivIB [Clostridium sp. MT-14]|uniref:FtsQ-type POTRA domain-containing protein n=1 Tax=Clostridium aromativorans TaxID=2836848 RepID=A0ABS8N2V8_9CLOT|nr:MULTISPECIES: FtsQ-type POTRA domain-containing protein [Clostridium]KAA8676143.1 FtsQ-type POTRA domain-containing protein [Clostridium sp. HV4-5-A1G]MCC9294016.1 FtsQ-type POTRA domain-containing protein [Clostridium aromativorans]CAB1242244.1 Cell division protein DivIB [Clostridiaceae bacterium BL-3]
MSEFPLKTDNEMILKRRKKRRVKRAFIFMLFLIALFFTLCLKLPYFNIRHIEVHGNKNVLSTDIVNRSGIYVGNNIFYVDLKDANSGILSNPYVEDVVINRELPGTININVKEREALFYYESNRKYYIIDGNGVLLQKVDNINNMHLIRLDGIDYTKTDIGEAISSKKEERKIKIVASLGNIIVNNNLPFSLTYVDVSDLLDVKAYFSNICIKLGSGENLDKKMNRALNILLQEKLNGAKGYIDVRFDGNPVYKVGG